MVVRARTKSVLCTVYYVISYSFRKKSIKTGNIKGYITKNELPFLENVISVLFS